MAENQEEATSETDKLSYEIFSILESKFLFGYDDQKLWLPKHRIHPTNNESTPSTPPSSSSQSNNANDVRNTVIKSQRGKICVLSIDGGGMRNIISGKALSYLEHALRAKSGDPDARIADYIDVATGTGFGGIFTAMLFSPAENGRPISRADDTWRFLAEQGPRIYKSKSRLLLRRRRPRKSGLESLMKEAFSDLTLRDTLKPVLIPCYDLSSTAPFLFSRADALESDGFDFRLREVCVATSADPGVFEPVLMKSIDGATKCVAVSGGLAMSNPTAAAITHVLHNKHEFPFVRGVEDILVVSIGIGQFLEDGKTSYGYDKVKGWKEKDWARPIARIGGDTHADFVDHSLAMAYAQSRSTNYVRIQTNGPTSGKCGLNMDTDPSPENVKILVGIADEMLKQKNVESVLFGGKRIGEQSNAEKLDWFAGELVLEHQRRSCRIAPTVAFKQPTPRPS